MEDLGDLTPMIDALVISGVITGTSERSVRPLDLKFSILEDVSTPQLSQVPSGPLEVPGSCIETPSLQVHLSGDLVRNPEPDGFRNDWISDGPF